MACQHPPEERLRVYEGRAVPRDDRALCGLCGELLYRTVDAAAEHRAPPPSSTARDSAAPSV